MTDITSATSFDRYASDETALALADVTDTGALMAAAAHLRDDGFGRLVTYSRKVFLPLTHLCRDVCHYCTFARTPKRIGTPYMSVDDVLKVAHEGVALGCREALFTLGEKPELRYRAAREALAALGFASTLEYVAHIAKIVIDETGLLPHINAGCMSRDEITMLRQVSASMGIMLESASERLCGKGMPHYGSPDKQPAARLATLEEAGRAQVPFTSGILIGIGETRRERIESMLALRAAHRHHGHLQEVIVQNFRAKPGTKMAQLPEPDLEERLWTIAAARLIFGAGMSIQAPPNLSPGVLGQIIAAGINDWGGVSPLTPDFVNPEAPWPHLEELAAATQLAGKHLTERLTIYPQYVRQPVRWLDPALVAPVLRQVDAAGLAREDEWLTGQSAALPRWLQRVPYRRQDTAAALMPVLEHAAAGEPLMEAEIVALFAARGDDFERVCTAADTLRRETVGDTVRYIVNRNINYTNICYFHCQFCAFSKGRCSENLRERPYDLGYEEIVRRSVEAWERGATEVCLQGGIHPNYTGEHYLKVCRSIKAAIPQLHIHAFSPLEVYQGAQTLGLSLGEFLQQLKNAGLGTLPGTAAEILDDEVRAVICQDKINTAQWLQVMETAHRTGLNTTATIMFGHVDGYHHWARHLLRVRQLQQHTGGFTEFVPLPFVAAEAPIYRKGRARRGPTAREAILMHAVARLVLHPLIPNIQASWIKMGLEGVDYCLKAGANDLGGTLMNEAITRAAGASHGEELSPVQMETLIAGLGRNSEQRTTRYDSVDNERRETSFAAAPLSIVVNSAPPKRDPETRGVLARRRARAGWQ